MKIEPMLLQETDEEPFQKFGNWIYQIKYDGERAIAHIKEGKVVGLVSRSGAPMLFRFPELRQLEFKFKTAILDCEIVVFKEGRSDFDYILKRKSEPLAKDIETNPVSMVVFDLIYLDSQLVINKPYKTRYGMLQTIIDPSPNLILAPIYSNGQELWAEVQAKDLEGVVIKNPDALYELGKRSKSYLKFKNYKNADVLVEKSEPNEKGSKIIGKAMIGDEEIVVECQIPSEVVSVGCIKRIKYLNITKDRKLRMPTRW